MALPQEFCRRMESLLGDEMPNFLSALASSPSRALRFNPDKTDAETLKKILGEENFEPLEFGENAYRFVFDGIGNLPWHHAGALYVQEPAAMAPVFALEKEPVFRILDLCAAPGGKSLQACAHLLSDDGVIVCNEPEKARRKILMQNLERMGEKRCQVTLFDARNLPEEWSEWFDLVICDAPCSGEGMMRKSTEAEEGWSMENVLLCAERQRAILEEAARVLAPQGRLLYSTCTWAPEENEETVAHFLERHPDFSLIPPNEKVLQVSAPGISLSHSSASLSLTRRFYPHLFRGEGQYLAVFKKGGQKSQEAPLPKKKQKEKKKKADVSAAVVTEFFEQNLLSVPSETVYFREEDVFLLPKGGISPSLCTSPGVLVGTVQKGRLIPHHRFFLAYAASFRRKVTLEKDDPRIEAWLRGEEISVDGEKGYAILFCDNCPLGGIKISNGKGKNLYPKGLRKV